jgi:CRISPR-associated exonuclease Cas4
MLWLLAPALGVALLSLLVVALTLRLRAAAGFAGGTTEALGDVTLFSARLGLVGRPDRLVRDGEFLIPEEWKPSANRLFPSHRLQIGVYLVLVEERFGIRPPFGFVVIQGDESVRVENTEALRSEVLAVAAKIREHRRELGEEIQFRNQPGSAGRAASEGIAVKRHLPRVRRRRDRL